VAEQDGTPFGEIHEQPAETCALGSGVHGHVPDVQGVPVLGQLDQAGHRLPGHPELARVDGGIVVGQHRGGRPVHPAEVPGVGGGHDLPDGGQVGRGGRARIHQPRVGAEGFTAR
jgi:hypothetical protein